MVGLGIGAQSTGAPIVQVYHEKSFILPDVSRVLACLYEKKVDFQAHTASYKSLLRLQASSHAPVPFYDGPTFLEESREICRYIAEKYEHQGYPFLLGKDALERASVEQWLHNEEYAFNPPSRALFCHLAFPLGEEDDDDIDIHTMKLEEVLDVYEQRLSDSEFLVGNKFTLADLVHLPNSHYIKASNKFLYLYDSRKNVRRWWDAISDRDSWKQVLRYMKDVEEQNKQEELKKQKKQEEDSRTSANPIRVYSRKQTRTEPRTILVPPDTMSSSSRIPQTKKPLPSDTDQPGASDFYKSDSTATSVDSRFKEVPYSGRTPPELEPTDTSSSKVHTTDVHPRLQVDQWQAATTGLNDQKHDAGHLMSTQQGKPRKDVQQYPSQDSEQATTHPVPQEPTSMELVQGREKATQRPYTDQSGDVLSPLPQQTTGAPEIVEDYATDQRGAVLPPSTQEHGVTPRQAAAKDARSRISSQAAYPGVQDTSKQPRDSGSVPRQGEAQDARDIFDDSEAADSTISSERYSYTSQSYLPRQDLDGARHATAPFETRYPGVEDTSKQAKNKMSTPRQMTDHDAGDITEETKFSESSSYRVQPSHFERADAPSRKEETIDDTFKETESRDPSFLRDQQYGTGQTASSSAEQEVNLGGHGVAPPSQTRYQSLTPPSKTRYPIAKDASKQPRDGSIPKHQRASDAPYILNEKLSTTAPAKAKTHDDSGTKEPYKKDTTNEQIVVPPLLRNEPTSQVQHTSLQGPASHGDLSTKPSKIEQWQRASVPLNDLTSRSGDDEISMATIDQKLAATSHQATPSSEDLNQMAKESVEQRVQPAVQIETETPGVQSASSSFPGASAAHHATSADKTARQSIIDKRIEEPTKIPPIPDSAPAHTKRETPDGHEIVDSELASTPDGHISEAAKIRHDQATVHEDFHHVNLSAHDVAKDTFKEAKVAESTPSSAKPMYPQRPAPTPRHAEVEDTWDNRTKGRETVPDQQKMVEQWTGTAREQVSDRWKAIPPSRQAAAEDVRGATGDTIQSADVLDTSEKSRGAYEKTKVPVQEQETSSVDQKPLVAQDSREQAHTIPAGDKADGSTRKHKQTSDAPDTFVEKLNASEPARVKTHGDFSPEEPYRKETMDDLKVAPPLSTRELTSRAQPPSESSYDAALHRDLSNKPSTIYQWQRASGPVHDVTTSSGKDEVARPTVDEKPTPMSQQKSDEKRVETPVPIEAELSGVQHASPSFSGASGNDRATIGDKFAKKSIIDERVGEPTQMQTSSPDAHPASEPTKRETPEGHEIDDIELVSTPGGQMSAAKKARDDPARVHEDVYDAFKETKVAYYTPSSAQPMHSQQPALTPSRQTQVEEASDKSMQSRETTPEQQKVVERKKDISGEQLSDHQKAIRPSRQPAAEDAPIGDTVQSPDILDTPKKSRRTFEEDIGPGSTLPKAQVLDAQDSQLTKGESTVPTTDQRKDWKYAKDDETVTEENSLSTKRLREMFEESTSTAPKTQVTNSEGSNKLEKTSSVYHEGTLAAQAMEEAQIIPADEKVDGSTSEHHESSGAPHTYGEKLSASAPARADIHDDHGAEEQYKKYTADDQKVSPSLSSQKTASQAQLEPLQRAVPDGDFPSKSLTIDQWQRTSAPLHGVITDSGDAQTGDLEKTELAKPTVTDQESTVPVADPTSMAPQRAGIAPDEGAHSEQKSTLSDKGSTRAAQPPSPVEPMKADSNVSAANYRQQARPSAPSTIGIPASDTQGVIGNIQEVTPDNGHTDHSGKPLVPTQEQVSHASQTIPGQEEMTTPPGAQVFPTSDTQLASAEVHEITPDDQQTVESITPLVSSGKQGSDVRSPFEPGEVDPVEKKFAPSDRKSPYSSDQSISGEPRKVQTVIPTAEQTKAPPTIIDIPDRKQAPTSEDMLDTRATHGDVHRTGTIEPPRRPLSVEGEESSSATQSSSPRVTRDSLYTELENVQSVKPSRTPDARGITPSEVALAEQKSAPSGQGSADPAQPAFSRGPRNEEIRDSTPSAIIISSTDPNKGDTIVSVRDEAKDSQTIRGPQDILPAGYPSGKVQENVTGDDLGKAKPSRPSSAVQEGKPSKASASGIQLGSVPNEVSVDEQKFAPPGQDSAYLVRPPSSAEPSKEIGDLAPSTQLSSTTDVRNEGAIVAAADEATDSQTTSGRQATFSAPPSYTQGPLGKLQEDEPADNSDVAKSSKPPSVVQEGKSAAAGPISSLDTQHGASPDPAVAQKFAPSGQDSVHPVQKSFSTEPTKEDTVVAATDQTSTLERIVDKKYMTPAADKAKPPFSGTPDASRKTQKTAVDDHIDEKLPSKGRVSPDRHVSDSPQGFTPEAPGDVVKETTLGSSHAETSNTGPDSIPIRGDAHLSSSDMPASSSLPETQDLQNSASAQTVISDSLGKIKSPGHLSTDQAMAPIMSPSVPSVAPLGTVPGTISVQPPQKASTASTVDLESVPGTQDRIAQGKTTPAEQKSAGSDQEPGHTTEHPSFAGPRKEANTAATDQPKVPQGSETTVRHQAPPDSREALQKYHQPSLAVLPSDVGDGPPPGLQSAVVDKETTQTSVTEPTSKPTRGYVLPTRSVQNQEAEPPAATEAPTSESLQDTSISQNDPFANTESPRQFSTDQSKAPAINSAAPSGAPEGTKPGPNSSQLVQPPLSTEPTKEDTVVTAADLTEDMQTRTHQQAIPATDTFKSPLPGTQDTSRKFQESTPDDDHIDEPLPSKEHFPRQGSSSEPRKGQTSDPYGTNIDEKTTTFPSSQANISESRSGLTPTLGDVPSIGEGPAENYSPKPGTQTQVPAATQDVSPYTSSKAKSTGEGAKPSAGYQASSPDTQLGSPQTQGEAAPAVQTFAVSDKESANASKSLASAEPRKEETDAATANQASVPLTNVSHQVTRSTQDASDALSRDQESSPLDDQIKYLGSPATANQEETSRAERDSEGSAPKVHRAIVDKKTTLPSSQAQTSSTWPDSTRISGDPRLSGAGVPATNFIKKQETEPPAATKAPTSEGLQGSVFAQNDSLGNIESTRQVSTNQTEAAAISSAAPSGAPEGTEPGPNFSRSVQPPLSTEPTKEDTHQQAILAPGSVKPPFLGTQDASRKYQESIPDDGRIDEPLPSQEHVPRQGSSSEPRKQQTSDPYGTNIGEKATTFPSSQANISESRSGLAPKLGDAPSIGEGPAENYSPKPGAQTQVPAATQDVSPYASSKAKSIGQGAKPSAGYQASSPDTQLGSPQTHGEAAPAVQTFAVSDKESANASKSLASAEPRKEETVAATANQASVPLTNVSHQVTRSTQDASDALSRDQESSPLDDQIKYLGNPATANQEEASRAERDSEGPAPKVHRAIVDEKTTLPSSQAQTSSTWPDSTQISGDPRLSGAGVPATSFIKKQETEPPAATKTPTSEGLQGSVFAQNDSFGNIESTRQVSTNQTEAAAISSAAPSGAPEGTEPGPNSSRSVQPPLSTEPTKEDTVVAAADHTEDMQTVTHQQAVLPPDTVKPPFLGAQDASRKYQESIPDDGRIDEPIPSQENVPRQGSSSEPLEGQSKVQLQSEDKTQGREPDASSSETEHPSKGDFPANSYENNSSQSQEEASNKSVEQSSDIRNKDNDSSRLDDSNQSHQAGDLKN